MEIMLLEKLAERGGFEPPKRGLDAYTLSRRAPSTARTPLRWNLKAAFRPRSGAQILAVTGDDHNKIARRRGSCAPRCVEWFSGRLIAARANFVAARQNGLMSYLVLARKWRPKRFAELVGQEHVVRALTNALDSG